MLRFALIVATSYLLGSIPFGYLLVRIFRGEDVRRSGSGNIGATNVSRKSPLLGILTLLLDAFKGASAVLFAIAVDPAAFSATSIQLGVRLPAWSAPNLVQWASLAALFAVLGHMFPIWLKFRGGKGVATGLGAFILISPEAVLLAMGTFVVVLLAFRYVSLGSIVAVAIFPFLAWIVRDFGTWPSLALMSITSLAIVARHHANIGRLRAGTEPSLMSAQRTRNVDHP
ncbi:MAG TPA: glycerol-3-phosphate 1-O-acyltransferase PlsY [Candidatus Sulfotelmatobacter sp.]|jgi:glycerol-3-phosphate acyltransferase PlsY